MHPDGNNRCSFDNDINICADEGCKIPVCRGACYSGNLLRPFGHNIVDGGNGKTGCMLGNNVPDISTAKQPDLHHDKQIKGIIG